jgi:hypothetical protein
MTNERARSDAMRRIIAALAASELTANDIEKLAESFRTDRSFTNELAESLEALAMAFDRTSRRSFHDTPHFTNPVSKHVYGLLLDLQSRRRISRAEAIGLIGDAWPPAREWQSDRRRSFAGIVRDFVERAPMAAQHQVLDKLETRIPEEDPYLKGIIRRSEQ